MYVYIRSEPNLWTVGFYDPDGKWEPESDHDNKKDASDRVAYLNGGIKPMELKVPYIEPKSPQSEREVG